MGTTLSGKTPATTFDALIKVGDNSALSASLKTISDGVGNDSPLKLSTAAVGIGSITNVETEINGKQATLVSGSSIKTINSTSVLGSGDISVQATLVSGTNIKSINSTSLLGSGDLSVQETLISGTNVKTINSTSLLGSGDVAVQETLVSGTNIKTINSTSLLGSGDISISASAGGSNSQIQFNDSGAFGADSLFNWDNTNKRLGVGETTPTARVHIKGEGATSGSSSMLLQNSAGTDLFKVRDDGRVLVDEYIYPADGTTNSRFRVSNSVGTYMYYSTGNLRVNPSLSYTSTTYGTVFSVSNTTGDFSLNGATGAKMAIKGNGATSATTALLVENSSGTDTLEVRDDGRVVAGTGATTNANGTFNVLHGTSNLTTRVFTVSRDSVLRGMDINSGGSTKISDSSGDQSFSHTATAVLEVSSTTQGFLPPRMTGTQRDAIESPASGLIIYNTTTNKAQCYNGTSWNDMF